MTPPETTPEENKISTDTSDDPNARHARKMAKIKTARDKMMAGKEGDKGLLIVHTGTGKGKSSSGFGMILRCIAHEMPCAVVQFIKGGWDTGERRIIETHFSELCEFHAMGEGFTWETQDLLDEINIALRYDYLDIAEVVAFLTSEKPPLTHVVMTGRNAKPELIEVADLVTEMTLIKHPFRSGIKAQPGVEF